MAIYMKFEGIPGNVTHSTYDKWIALDSLQWGVGRAISTPVGRAADREASEPSVSEVTFTKPLDDASGKLFEQACVGKDGKAVEICVASTGDPGDLYYKVALEECLVSGFSMSSSGDRPHESISLNFTQIKCKVTPTDTANKTGAGAVIGYDLRTTKKV